MTGIREGAEQRMSNSYTLSASTTIASDVARRMLGEDASLNDLSAHQLACEQIRRHGYCPPVGQYQAIATLSSPLELIDDPNFVEQIAATRLHEFCRQFFSIPRAERITLWTALDKQLVHLPQLHWRLRTLKGGLEIDGSPAKPTTPVERLAHQICELFVMTQADSLHALRKICVAAARKDRGRELVDTIEDLHRTMPEIAALRPSRVLPETLRRELQLQGPASVPVEHWKQLRQLHRISLLLVALVFAAVFIAGSLFGAKKLHPDKTQLSPFEKSMMSRLGVDVEEFERLSRTGHPGELTDREKQASANFAEALKKMHSALGEKSSFSVTPDSENFEARGQWLNRTSEQSDE